MKARGRKWSAADAAWLARQSPETRAQIAAVAAGSFRREECPVTGYDVKHCGCGAHKAGA